MVIRKRESGKSGFTLTEILVIFGIIVVLAGLVTTVLLRVKTSAKSVLCLSNLKQIAAAIQMYHSDYKATPNQIYPLLQNSGYITTAGVFKCPADRTTDPDSYGPFYLPRALTNSQKLFLGCPRHADKTIALFGWPQFNIARACKILWNGSPINQGEPVIGGELLFEDGTRVVINGTLPVRIMLSTVDQNKQIYSAISIPEGATGDLTVTHPVGFPSQFDVLTPSLITGVAGTKFTVTVQWIYSASSNLALCSTEINCAEGKVLAEVQNNGEKSEGTTAFKPVTAKTQFTIDATDGPITVKNYIKKKPVAATTLPNTTNPYNSSTDFWKWLKWWWTHL
ncbi:MAG: hypothetical protein ABII89_02090 [Candidatus Omnitrophota bacterium]